MWQLIAGPLFGLIGSGIEKFAEYKQDKLKAEERERDRAHELAVMEKEATLALQKITVEGQIRQSEAEQRSFDASYQFNNENLIPEGTKLTGWKLGLVVLVEVFSKLIRPASTCWYQFLVAAVFSWSAWKLVNAGSEVFSQKEIAEIFRHIVFSIIGLAETTLMWWYGIRRMSKRKEA